jgi:hypothetical protein
MPLATYHIYNWQVDTQNLLLVCSRVTGLATRAFDHTTRGYALDSKYNTLISKVRLPPSPPHGTSPRIHASQPSYAFILASCKRVKLEVLWLEQQG